MSYESQKIYFCIECEYNTLGKFQYYTLAISAMCHHCQYIYKNRLIHKHKHNVLSSFI